MTHVSLTIAVAASLLGLYLGPVCALVVYLTVLMWYPTYPVITLGTVDITSGRIIPIVQKYRQWRCYICPDQAEEFADIAVANALHRPVSDNQPGLSVMVARTVRGKEILEQAICDGFIEAETVSPEILPLWRPDQAASQGGLWARVQTLKAMRVPTPEYQRFDLFRLWISDLSIRQKIRSVVSTIKRVFVKKLGRARVMVSYPCSSGGDEQAQPVMKE